MTNQNRDNSDASFKQRTQGAGRNAQYDSELDPASKSLSEALGISFVILKIIMIVLVAAFLASGFETVGSDEQALVLRFGKIRGVGEERLLGPGLHWIFPYPIDEMVKIPVAKKVNLAISSFWYSVDDAEIIGQGPRRRDRVPGTLSPETEGYCLTRGEEQDAAGAGSDGSDYNIVHARWELTYQIDDPERFFKNVYVEDVKPGEIYFDVIKGRVTPLLQNLFDDAVVTAMVNYSIDEAISSQDRIRQHVERLLQDKQDQIESGIRVVRVQLTSTTWPRQVDAVFQASITASQASEKAISEAKLYAEKTLNEAAGPVAEELFAALRDDTISKERQELLWSQLAGSAQEKIAGARAYRTKVAEAARANAAYLQEILPEYRKRPKLVVQEIYLDAIENIFDNVDEKFIIQSTEGAKGKEIRVLLNRDRTIKPKSGKGQ